MELEAPELFEAELRDGAPATLRGGRCEACAFVAFPGYRYGCERCGADGLQPAELAGGGTVRTAIAVHRTRDRIPDGVATIALDEGPVIRAVLIQADPLPARGDRVRAVVQPLRHKTEVLALRFAPEA